MEYYVFHRDGEAEKVVLGRDFAGGQTPIVAVPGGCWKGLRLCAGVEFALMANVLSPEFTVERVRIGFRDEREVGEWVGRYRGKGEWATEELLRSLMGTFWKEGEGA